MIVEKLRLDGKLAIVTGAGRGLGKAMSLALAKAGADIVVAARTQNEIEQTAAELRQLGRRSVAIPTDVTNAREVGTMVERTIEQFGKVDILVNNAGNAQIGMGHLLSEITEEEWHQVMEHNLTATFLCCKAVSKYMSQRKYGRVINIASGAGLRALTNFFVYSVAKAGVIHLTKALALQWAREGITVNVIAQGSFAKTPPSSEDEARAMEARGRFYPLGRLGNPRDLGPLVVFLASDASSYITGTVITPDGGAMAGGYAPTGYAPITPPLELLS